MVIVILFVVLDVKKIRARSASWFWLDTGLFLVSLCVFVTVLLIAGTEFAGF